MRDYRLMIVALIIASAVTVSTNEDVEIPTSCPEVDPAKGAIRLRHEYNCIKYYECKQGQKILEVCPHRDTYGNRLHFNPKSQKCDWPNPKICNETISNRPRVCPPNLKQCIRIAHSKDCNKFYLCDHEREIVLECSKGLHFNPRTQMCDYPKNAGCEDSHVWTRCPPKGSHAKVRLPHECSCAKYYECVNGDQIRRWCPKGEHFDNKRRICTSSGDAGCMVRPTTPPTDALKKCPEDEVDRNVNLPHERDCSLYYKCTKGEMILQKCRDGLSFDSRTGVCDTPENITCDERACCNPGNGTTVTTPPNREIGTLPAPVDPEDPKCPVKGTVKLPHPKNCTLYYVCQEGRKTVEKCLWGLHYNPITTQCDWPSSVNCTSRSDS